jgi:hypothetical protein
MRIWVASALTGWQTRPATSAEGWTDRPETLANYATAEVEMLTCFITTAKAAAANSLRRANDRSRVGLSA